MFLQVLSMLVLLLYDGHICTNIYIFKVSFIGDFSQYCSFKVNSEIIQVNCTSQKDVNIWKLVAITFLLKITKRGKIHDLRKFSEPLAYDRSSLYHQMKCHHCHFINFTIISLDMLCDWKFWVHFSNYGGILRYWKHCRTASPLNFHPALCLSNCLTFVVLHSPFRDPLRCYVVTSSLIPSVRNSFSLFVFL